jgi:hypothetical protein
MPTGQLLGVSGDAIKILKYRLEKQTERDTEFGDDGSAMVKFVPPKSGCTINAAFPESGENTDEPLYMLCIMIVRVNPWGRIVWLQNAKIS